MCSLLYIEIFSQVLEWIETIRMRKSAKMSEDDSPTRNRSISRGDPDEHEELALGPAALGLHRVGTLPPKPQPTQPIQVLNARGMPARIRKKNKLFFDDDIVNDSKQLRSSVSPRKSSKPSSPAKTPVKVMKSRKGIASKYMKVKEDDKEEIIRIPSPNSFVIPFDKRIGQRIGLRLRNLLKLPKAHKWVSFEWFYSYIDKPLFDGENDFEICLKAAFPQLKTRMLTRAEWSKIRSMMGKPRRCSQAFFDEERRELERKRQKIRFLQIRKTVTDPNFIKDLPGEIPLPLPVGTKVTARLRQPQDGIFTGVVDAVDTLTSTYRITFNRPGLGTHSIPDYEVVANDFSETLPLSSLTQEFRPRFGARSSLISPSRFSRNSLNKSDPLLGQELYESQFKNPVIARETIGGFPIKLLELIVRLKKTLAFKQSKLQRLRDMNTEAEMHKSHGDAYPEDFQRRYAGIVISMEKLNKDLQDYLNQVQTYASELTKEPHIQAMLAPSYLREKCRELADEAVQRNNQNTVQDDNILSLITDLATLMLVASHLSSGDNVHILKVLEGCVEEVKNRLDSDNVEVFQKNVQIHMHHIQLGLGQLANSFNSSNTSNGNVEEASIY